MKNKIKGKDSFLITLSKIRKKKFPLLPSLGNQTLFPPIKSLDLV